MLSERSQTQAHAQGFSPMRGFRLLCIIIILGALYIIITTICNYTYGIKVKGGVFI